MATQKQRRLGRGLSSLIQGGAPAEVEAAGGLSINTQSEIEASETTGNVSGVETGAGGPVRSVPVSSVRPSRFQPRRSFDEAALAQLADSIGRSGLLQPIIVRPLAEGGYELVAGERRWRAAQAAGLVELPAVVRELSDEDAAECALVENIQREDLNPMERAHGLLNLSARFGLDHAQIGARVGLDRSTVANLIRLTELEEPIQALVSSGRLQMGHARALLGLAPGEARLGLAERAAAGSWSVRQVESAVQSERRVASGPAGRGAPPTQREAVIADLEQRLGEYLGTKVRIVMGAGGGKGRLHVEFYSLEQFEGLMDRIGLGDGGAG